MQPVDGPGLGPVVVVVQGMALVIVAMIVITAVVRARRHRAEARRAWAEEVARPMLLKVVAGDEDGPSGAEIDPHVGPYLDIMAAGLAGKLRGGDRAALVGLLEERGTMDRTRERSRSLLVDRRLQAVEMLGGLGSPSTVDDLVRRLDDVDDEVRRSAVRALGRTASPDAVPALLALLDDEERPIATHYVTLALLRIGPAGSRRLETALVTQGPVGRAAAAAVLGWLGETGAVDPLRGALDDPEPQVRACAVEALGRIGMPGAVEEMVGLLEAEQPEEVRLAAATALGRLEDPQAVPALAAVLGESHRMSLAAAEALNRLGPSGRASLAERADLAEARELLPASDQEPPASQELITV